MFNKMHSKADDLSTPDKPAPVPQKVALSQREISKEHATTGNPYSSPVTPLNSAYPEGPDPGSGVPDLDFGKAFQVCVSSSAIQVVAEVTIAIACVIVFAGLADSAQVQLFVALQVVVQVLGFFIFAWISKLRLPTSWSKVIRVSGLFYAIWISIGIFAVAPVALTMLVQSWL